MEYYSEDLGAQVYDCRLSTRPAALRGLRVVVVSLGCLAGQFSTFELKFTPGPAGLPGLAGPALRGLRPTLRGLRPALRGLRPALRGL